MARPGALNIAYVSAVLCQFLSHIERVEIYYDEIRLLTIPTE